jgi:hypothetical protein
VVGDLLERPARTYRHPNLEAPAMIGSGQNWQAWTVTVQQLGGQAVTWPFGWNGDNNGPYIGAPAARFDIDTFTNLVNSGVIGANDPSGITNNGQYAYVLAPSSVVNTAPSNTQMSVANQVADFFFSDWTEALAAFPGQLAKEINGVVGYAGNILSNAANVAGGVVAAGVGSLLTGPVLLAGGALAVVAFLYFQRQRGR